MVIVETSRTNNEEIKNRNFEYAIDTWFKNNVKANNPSVKSYECVQSYLNCFYMKIYMMDDFDQLSVEQQYRFIEEVYQSYNESRRHLTVLTGLNKVEEGSTNYLTDFKSRLQFITSDKKYNHRNNVVNIGGEEYYFPGSYNDQIHRINAKQWIEFNSLQRESAVSEVLNYWGGMGVVVGADLDWFMNKL